MKSTLIVATLFAAALTSASTIPAFAKTNNGAFQQSVEANNNAGDACTKTAEFYSASIKYMNAAKDKKTRTAARDDANWAIEAGFGMGCAWVDGV